MLNYSYIPIEEQKKRVQYVGNVISIAEILNIELFHGRHTVVFATTIGVESHRIVSSTTRQLL